MSLSNLTVVNEFCNLTESPDGSYWPHPGTYISVQVTSQGEHYVELQIDGARASLTHYAPYGTQITLSTTVPNDGRPHTIEVVDTGKEGTEPARSGGITVTSNCAGVVYQEVTGAIHNPTTGDYFFEITLYHNGFWSEPVTCRLLVDGQPATGNITLTPSGAGSEQKVELHIPADGKPHVIKGEIRGNGWLTEPCLWYVVPAQQGPPGPPDPGELASEYIPGETVIIESTNDETPLATDGSEWVLVEISPRGENNWIPVGGLIAPNEEGAWSTTIETNPQDFPSGSKWDVRARRFRNYQESNPTFQYFDMIEGQTGGGSLPPPRFDLSWMYARGNDWQMIFGYGIPGARIEFRIEPVSEWASGEVPEPCTVYYDGLWFAWIYARQSRNPGQSVIRYYARQRLNGRMSSWSDPMEVTWYYDYR